MDIPLPDKIPLPEGEEDMYESEHTSVSPVEDSTNLSQEDDQKNVPGPPPSDPPPSNPIAQPSNFIAPLNELGPLPQHDIPNPSHSHGMFATGGLPNLNLPPPPGPHFSAPPPGPHFSTPPPGFPPLNQPPPGMMHFSQPPPSILQQMKGPPPPPILKDTPFILKTSTNESVTASTHERYSPSRVTADDDEASATEGGEEKGRAQEGDDGSAEKTLDTTANTTLKKPVKNVFKGRTSLLGKAGAKKRLMAFSGKTSFNITKASKVTAGSVLEENDEAEKSAKKPIVPVVKKKKEEKKSMIEHIREEETRIKEAIGLKQFHMPFNLYGPGLFPISKLLDNPEELAKFEEKVKGMPDRLAAYEQKEKKRLEDKEKEKVKEKQREKDKRKERESGRSKDSENEKNRNNDRRNDEVDSKRKSKFIPKSWREFKNNNITFEDIQKLFREYQENRSRDHRRRNFVDDIEAKLMVPLRVKSKNKGVVDKEFPAHMICNTNTKPHITFSINPHEYRAHFLNRYEIKQHKSLESWTLLKEFWNSYSNFKPVNEGESSREWYEASWSIEAICVRADLRADAQKGKNSEETDIAFKSRWDSDNEAEENASHTKEKLRKSSQITKKQPTDKENIKHKKVKDGKFSEGLTEEYDLFLKSLDDEDEQSKEKAIKGNKDGDDFKEVENTNKDIDEEEPGETICKDQDSDVSVTVEPPNKELSVKKKKIKKIKKQKKDAKKKKKKEEKKAKKKAKKAKKKLKEQKEKEMDSKMEEASDIDTQENEKGAIKSPRGNASHEDVKYNDDSLSKYQEENDSRYVNSVSRSEDNSPQRNERPIHEDQFDIDETQVSRDRSNYDDYYENKYTSSKDNKINRSYEGNFSKRDCNSLDYESEEFENRYAKQKFSNPKDEFREKQSSHKDYKEISNNFERRIRENEYEREYKESHHSRYDNKLRKDEMDYINNEKNNYNDLGGTMLYISDSENDEYEESYDKSISDRKERKKSDRAYKNEDLQYSERYYDEKDSRNSNRLEKQLDTVNRDDRTSGHKTKIRKEKLPVTFKVSGTKYSEAQIKLPPGFSAEDEQENVSEVSNNNLEDEDSGKEDHVVGSLADTLRALRQIGSGKSDIKDIGKNKEKNIYIKSKESTSEYLYECEEDSMKWKDKNHLQKSSGRGIDTSRHKDYSPRAEEIYNYDRLQRSRSPEEFKRYQSNSPRERSPRQSSPRSSLIRKTRSPRRSPSPTRELSPVERSRYSEKHHQSYKSPDYENHYEDHRSKIYEDRSKSSKYQDFGESHHHGEEKELGESYHGPPEHSSYESYSARNEKYSTERERSPAFIDDRHKHLSADHSSREAYGRIDDRERSSNLEKQKYKNSLSTESGKFISHSRENLSAESSNTGYYSSEDDFEHSRSNSSDRKETQFNSGYSNTTTEINSISDDKNSDRRGPSSYFTKDFKEHDRYASGIEEYPNRRDRKLYDREDSHDGEYYRHEGDKNIDQHEIYRSRSEYRSPETTIDRKFREKDDTYNGSDEIERESSKVVIRSPVRKEVRQSHRSYDIEERECSNFSNNHSNRDVRIENRDEYYDYVSSPIKKERSCAENRNQDKGSYSHHREDVRSSEINDFNSKQSNSLDHDGKHITFSPESSSHIRKNSYHEYSASPNRYEYTKSHTSLSESRSVKTRSPLREESSSQKNISPTHIRSINKRAISPALKSPPPKVQRSPRRIAELSSRGSRSPSRSSRMYSPARSRSPSRRISPSQTERSPNYGISSPRSKLSNNEVLPVEGRSNSPRRMSISPQRRISKSQYQSSRSPQRRISRSPQRRLSVSPQRLRSPYRKTRSSTSPSKRPVQSHYGRISPHRLPHRQFSRSPNRRVSRSPQRRLSKSPPGRLSRSPQRRLSRSPQRRLSRSPQRRQSPYRVLSSPNRRKSCSQERELSRSPLRRSKSPERKVGSPNLTKITLPDEYESNGTKQPAKIPLPDDHGNHGSQEYTKNPLPDNKERQTSSIHDMHEVLKLSSNESNWAWDQEKKCWLPPSLEVLDTNKQNENEDKVSSENKFSLSESTIKIDADSTISDSELTGHQESPITPESPSSSSSSPPNESPRRLTLDERLKQEHGVTVQEDKPSHPTMSQLYKWGYPVQSSQVIQVGNMLEILPQLQATNSQTSLIEQVTNSAKVIQVGNMLEILPQLHSTNSQTSLIEQVTNSAKMIPTVSGEILSSSAASSNSNQQQNTVTSTANISIPSNLAFLDSSVDKAIISQALLTLKALNQGNMKKYTHIDPQIQAEDMLTPDINMIAREQLKQKRRELKERRRQEREARREKRHLKSLELARREAFAALASEHPEGVVDDADEEALIREAMFETPNLGSPVPDYEVIDEDEEEKEEEARERRQKRYQPVPLPPAADKGILMSPSYRARDDYHLKTVKFADGILPGEGTSPSGGEEIHSPPPPIHSSHSREKKLRKKRRIRIKMIKQYGAGTDEDYSPPPPPPGDPLFSVKLFPGFDHHYKANASGAAIIYTQPVLLPGVGGVISIPGVPVDDTPLIGSEGVSSPSVTMSPNGPIVPTPVTLKLSSGCDYNAETMQYIYTSSATQPTASTLVDTNLSKNK